MPPENQHNTQHRHEPAPCDLLLSGGRIVDGSGCTAYIGSVAITGDRISGIGEASGFLPRRQIDIGGKSICPGFIDAHTHDDQAVISTPDMVFKTSQGVTSLILGNCGVSLAPLICRDPPPSPLSEVAEMADFKYAKFEDYLDAVEQAPPAVNVAALVGHTTLRAGAMERIDRAANADERASMRAACQEALDAGAIGLSSGLFYPPAFAAPAEEVIDLARIAGMVGGVYAAHIRCEADNIDAALDEAFHIAQQGNVRLILSHHKLSGAENFGRSRETLARIARARTGQPVAFDVYPYTASSTMLNRMSWSAATRTLVTWSTPHPEAAGRDLAHIAQEMNITEEEALEVLSPGGAVYFMMHEDDVRRILSSPDAMIGSDGVPLKAMPHPRLYGTFTRVLGRYARDEGLFSFEEAVRRMTGLTAAQFGLADRGVIAPGAIADLVVIDQNTVSDTATYEEPTRLSTGVEAVYVSGECVYENGAPTGRRPGKVLRRRQNMRQI